MPTTAATIVVITGWPVIKPPTVFNAVTSFAFIDEAIHTNDVPPNTFISVLLIALPITPAQPPPVIALITCAPPSTPAIRPPIVPTTVSVSLIFSFSSLT